MRRSPMKCASRSKNSLWEFGGSRFARAYNKLKMGLLKFRRSPEYLRSEVCCGQGEGDEGLNKDHLEPALV